MSVHIEWANLNQGFSFLADPGTIQDAHGSTNDGPGIIIGECCIEGTPEQLIYLAEQIIRHFACTGSEIAESISCDQPVCHVHGR